MEELIKDLNVMINHTNYRKLKLKHEEDTKKQVEIAEGNTERERAEGGRSQEYEDKLLNELTTAERHLLLIDAKNNTKPPLINLVRTHNPTSYLSAHPKTGTSLGKLDRTG